VDPLETTEGRTLPQLDKNASLELAPPQGVGEKNLIFRIRGQ